MTISDIIATVRAVPARGSDDPRPRAPLAHAATRAIRGGAEAVRAANEEDRAALLAAAAATGYAPIARALDEVLADVAQPGGWTGADLKAWRKRMGWTVREAAFELRIHEHAVKNLEAGKRSVRGTLQRLAELLEQSARPAA